IEAGFPEAAAVAQQREPTVRLRAWSQQDDRVAVGQREGDLDARAPVAREVRDAVAAHEDREAALHRESDPAGVSGLAARVAEPDDAALDAAMKIMRGERQVELREPPREQP